MKKTLVLLGFALLLQTSVRGLGGVRLGSSADFVLTVLGQPSGALISGNDAILHFDQGLVELDTGRVTSFELVSEAEAEQARLDRQREQAEAEERRCEARERGMELRRELLSEPGVMTAPPAARVAIWQDFMRRYPDVAPPPDYFFALQQVEEERGFSRLETRLDEVEDLANRMAWLCELQRCREYYPLGGIVEGMRVTEIVGIPDIRWNFGPRRLVRCP
jgi:hypothetical protein